MRILLIVYTAKVLSNSPWSGFSVTLQFNYDFFIDYYLQRCKLFTTRRVVKSPSIAAVTVRMSIMKCDKFLNFHGIITAYFNCSYGAKLFVATLVSHLNNYILTSRYGNFYDSICFRPFSHALVYKGIYLNSATLL